MVATTQSHLILRADGDVRTGIGHLLRCLALAHSWLAGGGEATFLSDCRSEEVRRRIEAAGASFIPLPARHPERDDLLWTLHLAAQVRSGRPKGPRPWVVLDGYHFDSTYQRSIQTTGFPVVVIDDYAHCARYHADVLINQNAGAEHLDYSCDEDTRKLFGPRYALLRSEFRRWRGWRRRVRDEARRVLVTFGGSDPENATRTAIEALGELDSADFEVRVIVGTANPYAAELSEVARQTRPSVRIHILPHVDDMAEQMAWADIAVSAGGSTCWELAYMGVPTIVVTIARNQLGIAAALDQAGAATNLGPHANLPEHVLARSLGQLLCDPRRRQAMSDRGRALVDGMGAQRISDALAEHAHTTDAHSLPGK